MASTRENRLAEVIEAIKGDIIIGQLRPREHLVEDEIIAKYAISRHTVRAALSVLKDMGLIVRRPNRGAIVRDFSLKQVEDIYEVRMILQREAAARLPLPALPETLADLKAIHADYCRALDDGRLIDTNALNDAFHRRIWQSCNNQCLAKQIEELWLETTGIRWYGVGDPTLLRNSRAHHAKMIELMETGSREDFVALAVDHMLPPLIAFRRAHGIGIAGFTITGGSPAGEAE